MKRIISLILAFTMVLSLCVCTTVFADNLTDVALNKTTWCGYWYNDPNDGTHGGCERAVDDNIYTCFLNGSTGHEPGSANYIAIDLVKHYDVKSIVFNNSRYSANVPDERKNFDIQLSNDRDFSDCITIASVNEDAGHDVEQTVNVSETTKYRYVRFIKNDGTNAMCFRYIRVYADESTAVDIQNVAPNNIGTWSSGYYVDWGMKSANMFDGNSGTAGHSDGVGQEDGAAVGKININGFDWTYAVVDLGMMYTMDHFKIIDRNGRTTYGDNANLTIDLSNTKDFSEYYPVTTAEVYSNGIGTFDLEAEAKADKYRFVRIRSTSALYINECEVYADALSAEELYVPDIQNVATNNIGTWSSGYYVAWGMPSANMFDGNSNSAGHTDGGPNSTMDGAAVGKMNISGTDWAYAVVDLGMMYTMDHFRTIDRNGRASYNDNVNLTIDLSNTKDFSEYYTVTTAEVYSNGIGTFDLEAEAKADKYRFVRIRSTSALYINECEVYADANSAEVAPELANVALNKNTWSGGCYTGFGGGGKSDQMVNGQGGSITGAYNNNFWCSHLNETDGLDRTYQVGVDGVAYYWAVVDLGMRYKIYDIKLFEKSDAADMGGYFVDFSNDKDFGTFYTVKATENVADQHIYHTWKVEAEARAEKYQYVRLRTTTNCALVGEFEVYGDTLTCEGSTSSFTWYADDTMANEITGFDANGTAAIAFDFVNLESDETDYCDIYVAKYEGTKLISVEPYFNNAVGGGVRADFVRTVNVEKGYSYRAFAWDAGTLTPIADVSAELK